MVTNCNIALGLTIAQFAIGAGLAIFTAVNSDNFVAGATAAVFFLIAPILGICGLLCRGTCLILTHIVFSIIGLICIAISAIWSGFNINQKTTGAGKLLNDREYNIFMIVLSVVLIPLFVAMIYYYFKARSEDPSTFSTAKGYLYPLSYSLFEFAMPSIVKVILGLPIAHLIAGIVTGILWLMIDTFLGVIYILGSLLWPSVGMAAVVKKNACLMMAYIVVAGISLVGSVIGAGFYGFQGYTQTTHEGRSKIVNATKTKVPTHEELEKQAKYLFAITALLVLSIPLYGAILYFFIKARKEIMHQELATPNAPNNNSINNPPKPTNPPTNPPPKPVNPPAEPLGPSSSTSTAKPITKSTGAAP